MLHPGGAGVGNGNAEALAIVGELEAAVATDRNTRAKALVLRMYIAAAAGSLEEAIGLADRASERATTFELRRHALLMSAQYLRTSDRHLEADRRLLAALDTSTRRRCWAAIGVLRIMVVEGNVDPLPWWRAFREVLARLSFSGLEELTVPNDTPAAAIARLKLYCEARRRSVLVAG